MNRHLPSPLPHCYLAMPLSFPLSKVDTRFPGFRDAPLSETKRIHRIPIPCTHPRPLAPASRNSQCLPLLHSGSIYGPSVIRKALRWSVEFRKRFPQTTDRPTTALWYRHRVEPRATPRLPRKNALPWHSLATHSKATRWTIWTRLRPVAALSLPNQIISSLDFPSYAGVYRHLEVESLDFALKRKRRPLLPRRCQRIGPDQAGGHGYQ